mmetsp:Transcript_48564/g.152321  ORF Transcript_48564/g.152321 Transcript_48564/m.152321 type:complete len:421 (-) Transcript_48564:730-1992(-)
MKIDPSSEAHAVTCRLLDGTSVDILKYEAELVRSVACLKQAMVVGDARPYLAALLSLKTVPGTKELHADAKEAARRGGSDAKTVKDACLCDNFQRHMSEQIALFNAGVSCWIQRFVIVPFKLPKTNRLRDPRVRQELTDKYRITISNLYRQDTHTLTPPALELEKSRMSPALASSSLSCIEPDCLLAHSIMLRDVELSPSSSVDVQDEEIDELHVHLDLNLVGESERARRKVKEEGPCEGLRSADLSPARLHECSDDPQNFDLEDQDAQVCAFDTAEPEGMQAAAATEKRITRKAKGSNKKSKPALNSLALQAERMGMLAAESMEDCAERLPSWATGKRREKKKKEKRSEFVSLRQRPEDPQPERPGVAVRDPRSDRQGEEGGETEAESWTGTGRPSFLDRYIQVSSTGLDDAIPSLPSS